MKEKIKGLLKSKKFWIIFAIAVIAVIGISCGCVYAYNQTKDQMFAKYNVGDLYIETEGSNMTLESFGDNNYKVSESGVVTAFITPIKMKGGDYFTTTNKLADVSFPTYQGVSPTYTDSEKAWNIAAYDVAVNGDNGYSLYTMMLLPKTKKDGKYAYVVQYPCYGNYCVSEDTYTRISNALLVKFNITTETYLQLQTNLAQLYAAAFSQQQQQPE